MALAGGNIWEVQTGGSDTLNGGGFNPANGSMATDGAATVATGSSPVFTSASYTFVAGDVGHWLFIQAGTNWNIGWYQIASVAGGAATLTAGIGTAIRAQSNANHLPDGFNTAAGCASVASPTGATWAVDYSQSAAVPFSLTGLTTSASNAIIQTASATKAMVGNGLVIKSGTNFTTGYYEIVSAVAGVSLTVDRTCTTAAGSVGTAGIGGALATPGMAGGQAVASNAIFIKPGTYLCSLTNNVAAGRITTTTGQRWEGYSALRGDRAAKPIITSNANSISIFTINGVNSPGRFNSLELKLGVGNTSVVGFDIQAWAQFWDCKVTNLNVSGFKLSSTNLVTMTRCEANGCAIGFATGAVCATLTWCTTINCTTGFQISNGTSANSCISSGGTTGFSVGGGGSVMINCIAYNATTGFGSASDNYTAFGCVAVSCNTGFSVGAAWVNLVTCAGFSTTNISTATSGFVEGFITLSGDPFTNAAGGDFSLNNTAGAGALLRGTGYPVSFPGLSTTTTPDVGPVVRAAAGTSTDPGITNVRNGTGYQINGASLTGTCAVPSASDVKLGVAVDATTGTLSTGGGMRNAMRRI